MLEKLERKLGKYAIPNLINYLIGGYIIGYLFQFGSSISNINFTALMTLEPYLRVKVLSVPMASSTPCPPLDQAYPLQPPMQSATTCLLAMSCLYREVRLEP